MIEFHELSKVFPLLKGKEFEALVADIRENGVREPITILDGKILDGRNRYLAAQKAGVDCPQVQFANGSPVAFVISLNLHRRNLTPSQRALAAARLANTKTGYNQYAKEGAPAGVASNVDVAKMFDVSKRSVNRAKRVLQKANPEEIAAVEAGDATLYGTDGKVAKNKPQKRDSRYHERFLRSVAVAAQAAHNMRDTKIPPLSKDELRDSIADIVEMRKVLRETLEELRSDLKMKLDEFDTRQGNERQCS